MNAGDDAAAKRRAGEHAAEAVEDGAVVGLGTGSTVATRRSRRYVLVSGVADQLRGDDED